MMKTINDKMYALKKVFSVLLILDVIRMILTGITLVSTIQMLAEYGKIMIIVASVIVALTVAVMLFKILAKLFLIRSTSPAFSWSSGCKSYVAAAKILVLFDLGTVIIGLLSAGGEGATLINQGRLYLQILASGVEMIAIFVYLRTVKRIYSCR